MPQINSQQIYQHVEEALKNDKFSSLYCYFGEEPYLLQQAIRHMKACALSNISEDFNFSQFYAGDSKVEDICETVETLPMLASRRFVVVKDCQEFSDKEWEQLDSVLSNPISSTILLLTGSKLDKRKKYFKIISDNGVMVEFRRPFENQIPAWIKHICKAYLLEINEDALQLFHRLVGSQLLEIDSEIQKLKDFLGTRTLITLEDVASCVSKRREENVFQLVTHIASGNVVESLTQLAELLQAGQNEVGIVSLLARHIRILLVLKQGAEIGMVGQKLSQFAQIPNYYLHEYLAQNKLWTARKLEAALLVLAETDKALKSSPLSADLWLQNLIFKICEFTEQSPSLV